MHLEYANIPAFELRAVELPDPAFLHYKPEFPRLKHAWKEYGSFRKIIVIGHGGSITTFLGMYSALETDKDICIVSSTDPELIFDIKRQYKKDETLVIAISKSGENSTQVEAVLQFIEYPLVFIAGKGTPLEGIAKSIGAKIYLHPPIGGRYTGFTEVALLPASILGYDIEAYWNAGQSMLRQWRDSSNIAMNAAQIFYQLELDGKCDVFMPFYSHYLFTFRNLVMQLCHESFGKNGKGQTYIAQEAPEWQHHTMQRFFGGQKNVAGWFITVDHFRHDETTIVPNGMHSIHMKNGSLYDLHKIPLSYSMHAEFKASVEDAKINNIPVAAMFLDSINLSEIGTFVAFWQMYAVYSSLLRGSDPFDQPEVENSKKISWTKRQQYKQGQ